MTGIFQNSKKREGDNSILENVVCWFLGVLCSRSHSKAHKRGVGTGARDMCLNNNSVVVFRWQIEMGDYAGHFLSSARRDLIRTGSVFLHGNLNLSTFSHWGLPSRGSLQNTKKQMNKQHLHLSTKSGTC